MEGKNLNALVLEKDTLYEKDQFWSFIMKDRYIPECPIPHMVVWLKNQ